MKKWIINSIIIVTFIACSKIEKPNDIESTKTEFSEEPVNGSKAPNNNDAFLKQAIDGKISEYLDHDDLLELLLDNVALSDAVIKHAINQENIPNKIVEIITIVSSPVHQSTIQLIVIKRPEMNLTNILYAQTNLISNLEFSVVNAPVNVILFGGDITFEDNPGYRDINGEMVYCECTKRVTLSGNPTLIPYGNYAENDDFEPALGCNPEKWVCGKPEEVEPGGSDGTNAVYDVSCDDANARCIRRPKKAVK